MAADAIVTGGAQLGEGDAQGDAARASAASSAAAAATGAVEEVAASAEQAAGEGTAVKKAAAATNHTAITAQALTPHGLPAPAGIGSTSTVPGQGFTSRLSSGKLLRSGLPWKASGR